MGCLLKLVWYVVRHCLWLAAGCYLGFKAYQLGLDSLLF